MPKWNIELTDEFYGWWISLNDMQQDALQASIELLESNGPSLGRPHADTVKGSRHLNMKELRTQCAGKPIRTFFAFDPRRSAILLIGGDKTGDDRFYDRMIPLADELYDAHLLELRKEGLI
ncbi:MAG TPA: type II toxin-antitoxin system RelE/ParE family toxin [Tepidisphaeraceae bacterium]|jgi:hypothetical protein|nr:type II toxin-antitoxin system RelE/ParE family toxin [Tepidisphaeraceae bacterium]